MKTVVFLLADGFEELEFVAPFDIFKRAGLKVLLVSIMPGLMVKSVRNLTVQADCMFDEIQEQVFDVIFLPGGGPGTVELRKHAGVQKLLVKQREVQKEIAAICAAPLVLGDAGLLKNIPATCFPSCQEELSILGAQVVQDRVVLQQGIYTSRGAGSASEFAFALVEKWMGKEASQNIFAQMQFA